MHYPKKRLNISYLPSCLTAARALLQPLRLTFQCPKKNKTMVSMDIPICCHGNQNCTWLVQLKKDFRLTHSIFLHKHVCWIGITLCLRLPLHTAFAPWICIYIYIN